MSAVPETVLKEGVPMSGVWMIHTHGDPLGVVRQLLQSIWQNASLEGMLVPVYLSGDPGSSARLVLSPEQLNEADPCVPLVPVNAAKLVIQQAHKAPGKRYAAVLRSCESRALVEINKRQALDLSNWLKIGIDCLASYPEQDFAWRVEKAGSIEDLTRENLSHARQGGVAAHRYRHACQMCTHSAAQDSDVCICLLGLPVRNVILIQVSDPAIAARLQLDQITDGEPEAGLLAQHEQMVAMLNERHLHTMDRMMQELNKELPANVDELISHLEDCGPCRQALDACPIYGLELARSESRQSISRAAAIRWLVSCVSCGMCEQAVPDHLPLPAIIKRINQESKSELVTA